MGEDREKNSYVYEFDELNRMEKVYRGDGKWAEYEYDGTSARVGKTVGTASSEETETTKYYNMGATVLNEVSSEEGNTTNLIGAGIEARLSVTGSSITSAYFLQKNAHGDVTAAISGTERAATYDYDAFGNTLVEEGEINNPIRYSGEYLDEETGLIYLHARYYDSSIGRFISEDPIRDGMNWYAYCGNSPVMMVDPSGNHRQPVYDEVDGALVTIAEREDIRTLLREMGGVLKIEGRNIHIKALGGEAVINLDDYIGTEHYVDEHLHFSYGEFFELLGIEYQKQSVTVVVTPADEYWDRLTYAINKWGVSQIQTEYIEYINGSIGSALANLSGFLDAFCEDPYAAPPYMPEGKYQINQYTVEGKVIVSQKIGISPSNYYYSVDYLAFNPDNPDYILDILFYGWERP